MVLNKDKPLTLRQEILLALALKVALLTLIWLTWFSAPGDGRIDAAQVSAQLFPMPPSREHGHDASSRAR